MNNRSGFSTDDRPQLGESLRFIRRQRVIILAATVLATIVALVAAVIQAPSYDASAAVGFSDQSQDLSILGNVAVRAVEPDQLAAAKASTIESLPTLAAVRRAGIRLSEEEIASRLSASVEPTSNLVLIDASAPTAAGAARLANTTARVVVRQAVGEARNRYARAAGSIRRRITGLPRRKQGGDPTRAALQDQLSRLVSLQALASPASIARVAKLPDSPASPKPVRDGLLGAVVGLMVGLGAALLRNSLDRRMRSIDDVLEEVSLPLLARVEASALGHVSRPGAKVADQNGETESFRILRTNLSAMDVDRDLKVIAVTSAMPEEGKTTVASSLAMVMAATGKRTLLVECDGRRPTVRTRLGLTDVPGLFDYLAGAAEPVDLLQTVVIPGGARSADAEGAAGTTAAPALVCIAAGGNAAQPTEMLGSQRFKIFLAQVREVYDLVVLDTCPLLPVADTLELIPEVDGVVYCVRVDQTTREQVQAGLTAIRQFGDRPTGVVVTGLSRRSGYGGDYGDGYYGSPEP